MWLAGRKFLDEPPCVALLPVALFADTADFHSNEASQLHETPAHLNPRIIKKVAGSRSQPFCPTPQPSQASLSLSSQPPPESFFPKASRARSSAALPATPCPQAANGSVPPLASVLPTVASTMKHSPERDEVGHEPRCGNPVRGETSPTQLVLEFVNAVFRGQPIQPS